MTSTPWTAKPRASSAAPISSGSYHRGISQDQTADKENAQFLIPAKPPSQSQRVPPVPSLNIAAANQLGGDASAAKANFPRRAAAPAPPPKYPPPLAALSHVKQVDSDVDSDDDEIMALQQRRASIHRRSSLTGARLSAPVSQSATPVPSAPSSASSFRRSAAVSRQPSDAANAAGTAFQLLRFANSAAASTASTPTNAIGGASFAGRSRSSSLVSIQQVAFPVSEEQVHAVGCVTRENSLLSGQFSRRNSMNGSRSALCSTPEVRHVKAQLAEEAYHAMTDEVERRHKLFAPENVLVRRWIGFIAVARSAKLLLESGGRRVAEYNAALRAYDILGRLFVPIVRLHQSKRRRWASECIQRWILRMIMKRRAKKRDQAADMIRHLFQNKLSLFQHYAKYFSRCVVTVQRAFRAFKERRDAMVELNVRFIRKMEATYWSSAAESAQNMLSRKYLRFLEEQAEIKKKQRGGPRKSFTTSATDADIVPPALPASFPTFESLGKIPESVLKKNLRPLISARSRAWRAEVARRTTAAFENFKRSRGAGSMANIMKCPEECKRFVTIKLPPFRAFLTMSECFSALDNCARTLAELRGIPVIALHLCDGHPTSLPTTDEERSFLSTELSEASLYSDRLMESSTDTRRCSVANLLTLRRK